MKLICKDNFNRETISDSIIAENVDEYWAAEIKSALNDRLGENSPVFIDAVPEDYKLYKYEP